MTPLVLLSSLCLLGVAAWLVLRNDAPRPADPEPLLFLARPGHPSEEVLAAYVDGRADAGQAARLTLHFSVCPACRDRSLALIHRDVRVAPRRVLFPRAPLVLALLVLAPPFGGDPPQGCAGGRVLRVLLLGVARADERIGSQGEVPPPPPPPPPPPAPGLGRATLSTWDMVRLALRRARILAARVRPAPPPPGPVYVPPERMTMDEPEPIGVALVQAWLLAGVVLALVIAWWARREGRRG